MTTTRTLCLLFSWWLLAIIPSTAASLDPAIDSWLAGQTNIQTWSARFTQTRTFKSLTQPLTATGQVWFAAPNRFRWELGNPPQTVAVRAPKELLIVYPRLKRVEHYPLTGAQTGSWRDALALLEAGFPRSREQLESQYQLLSQTVTNGHARLVLQPRSEAARRMMPRVTIEFGTTDQTLKATELTFADGSALRNDFVEPVLNPAIEEKIFNPDLPADHKHIEPIRRGR